MDTSISNLYYWHWRTVFIVALGSCTPWITFASSPPLEPVVEVEENVYTFTSADNGAGPMWSFGSTSLVRIGNSVFASGLETLLDTKPLNNTQCTFWQRGSKDWSIVWKDAGRTREPCPLVAFPGQQKIFLSSNPTLNTPQQSGEGPAQPVLFEFSAIDQKRGPERYRPTWQGPPSLPSFTQHSYRSFAADGSSEELILFQNIDYTHTEWTFRDREGHWAANGKLAWPWGAGYDKPQPVRICYPNVGLKGHSLHFIGVSDIVEPNEKWRAFKRALTGREWDYDFRRLFYTWSSDITQGKFHDWIEIASREQTGGKVLPGDLWIAPDGAVHIVWTETALDESLRKKFFPKDTQRHELNYAVLHEGKVVSRQTLVAADEGKPAPIPHRPRFQATPDNRLFVFFYVDGTDEKGKPVVENRILEILGDGKATQMVRVPLAHPLNIFFTATTRGGSEPSRILDLLGTRSGTSNTISYARVRLY